MPYPIGTRLTFAGVAFTKMQSRHDADWYEWRSDNTPVAFLQNQAIEIELDFSDEEIQTLGESIEHTLRNAFALSAIDKELARPHVFAYYQDFVQDVGEEALGHMPVQKDGTHIFDFVQLRSLRIAQSSMTQDLYAVFAGHCDWELEHGLVLSFKDGKTLAKVGGHGHVCHADACADIAMNAYVFRGNYIQTHRDN